MTACIQCRIDSHPIRKCSSVIEAHAKIAESHRGHTVCDKAAYMHRGLNSLIFEALGVKPMNPEFSLSED